MMVYLPRPKAFILAGLSCLMLMLVIIDIARAGDIVTPARGSETRREILDAVRPVVEAQLHKPIQFVVNRMAVSKGWAFVALMPQRPGGKAIDISRTRLADEEFLDGVSTYALLKWDYGRWNLITSVIGPTDVAWAAWPKYFGAPKGIFF